MRPASISKPGSRSIGRARSVRSMPPWATVLSYLQRLVGREDAEDVLQRVFYEVWRHNGRYDPSRSLAGWVLGIARNRAIDHLRRQRNTAVALETLNDIRGEDGRELAERYARSHEVRSALIRLPEEQRDRRRR